MTKRSARPLSTLLAILALLAAAGCGGDDENEKFVDEANQACRDGKEQIEAAAGKDPKALIDAGDQFISRLKAVEAPGDKQDTYSEVVAANERFFDEFKKALRARDTEQIDALDETMGDEQAKELGLDDCVG